MTRRLALPASGLIALCAFVHACGGGGGSSGGGTPPTPAPPPPTSFLSTAQFPADTATDVPRQALILISFNDTVNPVTMTPATVTLTETVGAVVVPSTLTYNVCNNRIQLIPDAALNPGLQYTVTITAGLQDDDAEAVVPISRTFTTTALGDSVRPTFVGALSADANIGSETTEVMLDWTDATDDVSIAGAISYRVYISTQPACFNYDAPALIIPAGTTDVIVPGLAPRTLYSFVVRAVDAAGNESLNTNQANRTTFTSFLENVYPIVFNSCPQCHIPPNGQAWLATPQITMDYTTPASVYASWINITSSWGQGLRVDPGSPATSFLWIKISDPTPPAGGQMPLAPNPPLSADDQDVFFDWITEGALDN